MRFVVQKHKARTLHYDFRLETDNVLKSWAVPKGISLNPKIKRLALLVEDHPISYLLFEGEIAEGSYGAGTVIVWDTGEYILENNSNSISKQFQNWKIIFSLFGKKLKGKFTLVKIQKENQWLIIKAKDEYVSEEELTATRPESVISNKTKIVTKEIVNI